MKTTIKSTLAVFCLMAFGAGAALAADAINAKCPVKGKDVDASKTVDFKVEFCCEKCVAKFEKDPTAFTDKVAAAKDGKCPLSGKAIDAAQSVTVKIGVCCGGCQKKVKADPAKYFAKLKKDDA
jgi:hypothetical protein